VPVERLDRVDMWCPTLGPCTAGTEA